MHIEIKQGNIETVVRLSRQIPEFIEPAGVDEYNRRLKNVPHLILVAYVEKKPAGFKAGYERDGFFYSWMGGVLPKYRRHGVAKALAKRQEEWAKKQGYDHIIFKTRNQHNTMLIFALKNGFDIVGLKEKDDVKAYRILLRKEL